MYIAEMEREKLLLQWDFVPALQVMDIGSDLSVYEK